MFRLQTIAFRNDVAVVIANEVAANVLDKDPPLIIDGLIPCGGNAVHDHCYKRIFMTRTRSDEGSNRFCKLFKPEPENSKTKIPFSINDYGFSD